MPVSNSKKIAPKISFKEWITVQNAVELLNDQFGVNITESDFYKVALDNNLVLSLYLPENIPVRFCCKKELLLSPSLLNRENDQRVSEAIRNIIDPVSKDDYGQVKDEVEMIDGVWDIYLKGFDGNFLKELYHESLNVGSGDLAPGRKILTKNGDYCEVQTFYESLFDSDIYDSLNKEIIQLQHTGHDFFESEEIRKAFSQQKEIKNRAYKSACSLPENSLLIIKTEELLAFVDKYLDIIEDKVVMDFKETQYSNETVSPKEMNRKIMSPEKEKIEGEMNPKERKNMLVLIGILVDLLKTDSSNYNTQTLICRHVVNSYESCHGLSERTVNQRFAEANKLLEDLKLSIRTL